MHSRKGIGTAATRAGILERLVSQGFVQRVKGKGGQAAMLIPAQSGSALAAILPEPLRSPPADRPVGSGRFKRLRRAAGTGSLSLGGAGDGDGASSCLCTGGGM